jgi:hypothetical protein
MRYYDPVLYQSGVNFHIQAFAETQLRYALGNNPMQGMLTAVWMAVYVFDYAFD